MSQTKGIMQRTDEG